MKQPRTKILLDRNKRGSLLRRFCGLLTPRCGKDMQHVLRYLIIEGTMLTTLAATAWSGDHPASVLEELDVYNRAARECTVFVMDLPEFTDLRSRTPICKEAIALRQDLIQKGMKSELGYEWLSLPGGRP
jgi:hypothetical protein